MLSHLSNIGAEEKSRVHRYGPVHLIDRGAEDNSRVHGYGPMVVYVVICLNRPSLQCYRNIAMRNSKEEAFERTQHQQC